MPLFSRNKEIEVQSFILKMINNNCPELEAMIEGPRLDRRVNLTVVVVIVPVEHGKPVVDEAFTAVTKEFSTSGLAIVLDKQIGLDEAIIGFRWEADMIFIRGKAKHLNPIGGGFHQLGFQLTEIIPIGDWPELELLSF